jgi:hypothetical protein
VKYTYDPKKSQKQRAWISEKHDLAQLSSLIHNFIEEVLLCPICGKPELAIMVKKKKVGAECFACGKTNKLRFSDDLFTQYVVKHPPPLREMPVPKMPRPRRM